MFYRIAVTALLVGLSATLMLPALAQPPRKVKPNRDVKKAEEAKTQAEEESAAIMRLLKASIDTTGLSKQKVKLKEAIEYFSERFGGNLSIVIDSEAFADLGPEVANPYEEEVILPAVPSKMPMSSALRLILSQVGGGQATYVIRQGQIEIVPLRHATAARMLYRRVVGTYDQRPLKVVLAALSSETGLTINLDPKVGDKALSPITATFRNNTLEDALIAATEQAELKFVVHHTSIFVTTAKNAALMQKEEKKRAEFRKANPETVGYPRRLEAAK